LFNRQKQDAHIKPKRMHRFTKNICSNMSDHLGPSYKVTTSQLFHETTQPKYLQPAYPDPPTPLTLYRSSTRRTCTTTLQNQPFRHNNRYAEIPEVSPTGLCNTDGVSGFGSLSTPVSSEPSPGCVDFGSGVKARPNCLVHVTCEEDAAVERP
jgi:hypothetical protein